MALIKDGVMYLPIGCSCINQFQLEFSFENDGFKDSFLFDWSITTPEATARILKKKEEFLSSISDVEIFYQNRFRSKQEPGYHWWHLDKIIPKASLPIKVIEDLIPVYQELLSRHKYHIKKLFEHKYESVCCIWSNIQPNLKMAAERNGLKYDAFVLTKERYEQIILAVRELKWKNSNVIFITRLEDCDSNLYSKENVFFLNVERSEQYKGDVGLYDPVWTALKLK